MLLGPAYKCSYGSTRGSVELTGTQLCAPISSQADETSSNAPWKSIPTGPFESRWGHCQSYVSSLDQIVTYGGQGNTGVFSNEVWGLSTNLQWSMISSSAPWSGRSLSGCGQTTRSLHLIFGTNMDETTFDSIAMPSMTTSTTTPMAMSTTTATTTAITTAMTTSINVNTDVVTLTSSIAEHWVSTNGGKIWTMIPMNYKNFQARNGAQLSTRIDPITKAEIMILTGGHLYRDGALNDGQIREARSRQQQQQRQHTPECDGSEDERIQQQQAPCVLCVRTDGPCACVRDASSRVRASVDSSLSACCMSCFFIFLIFFPVWRFDSDPLDGAKGSWSLITSAAPWEPRFGHSFLALDDAAATLILAGGSSVAQVLSDVWRSVTGGYSWTLITAILPFRAFEGAMMTQGFAGSLLLIGGGTRSSADVALSVHNDVYASYDSGATWVQQSHQTVSLPARAYGGISLLGNTRVVCGGVTDSADSGRCYYQLIAPIRAPVITDARGAFSLSPPFQPQTIFSYSIKMVLQSSLPLSITSINVLYGNLGFKVDNDDSFSPWSGSRSIQLSMTTLGQHNIVIQHAQGSYLLQVMIVDSADCDAYWRNTGRIQAGCSYDQTSNVAALCPVNTFQPTMQLASAMGTPSVQCMPCPAQFHCTHTHTYTHIHTHTHRSSVSTAR
jgi:hypothetical protein